MLLKVMKKTIANRSRERPKSAPAQGSEQLRFLNMQGQYC